MPLGVFLGGVFCLRLKCSLLVEKDISYHVPGSVLGWPLLEDVLPHFSTSSYICSSQMSSSPHVGVPRPDFSVRLSSSWTLCTVFSPVKLCPRGGDSGSATSRPPSCTDTVRGAAPGVRPHRPSVSPRQFWLQPSRTPRVSAFSLLIPPEASRATDARCSFTKL